MDTNGKIVIFFKIFPKKYNKHKKNADLNSTDSWELWK